MPLRVENLFGLIGRKTLSVLDNLHEVACLINDVFYWTLISPLRGKHIRFRAVITELVRTGYNAIPIVVVIAFFVGVILALQSAYQLRRFGALIYVADLVGVSITRELGPIITAIIVAGRSGSAFAAEIGSMKAAEEVDALNTMGINPVRFLVVPKLIALMLMQPALTAFFDLIGMIGGFLLAITILEIYPYSYYVETINALSIKDLLTGLVKAWAFGVVITLVGAYHGFKVKAGAEEVGMRTTASVVSAIFLVIFFDFFFTTLFYYFL
ncbi:MAG: ABC transporter permease [Nitrospirae bacterium]|uniref:MlaE family ABC transporter permease n=1 Tax=Candidatus Magnetobacterium casense TaxID=1455061 RepID=UPI000696B8A8|nr:ABC transporter permease [Candidatus Magnetobacterium casensis]MBF0337555.1 ABC transporter permease [Nitrospirota bacterium]